MAQVGHLCWSSVLVLGLLCTMKEAPFIGHIRTTCSTDAPSDGELVGRCASDGTFRNSALRFSGSSVQCASQSLGSCRHRNSALRFSGCSVQCASQSIGSCRISEAPTLVSCDLAASRASMTPTLASCDQLFVKGPTRRGASGSPASILPIRATSSTREPSSRDELEIGCRPVMELEEEDDYDRKRPHVPHLAIRRIISMRETFGELDLKHDYRCDSPPSTNGSSDSLECREVSPRARLSCGDLEEPPDMPSVNLDRLRAARQSVLKRYAETSKARRSSWLCRLLGDTFLGADCSQEKAREADEDLCRVSSV